ncbi:hypothetical protein WCP94_000705 (plasmid) [Bilophila wadsworthia]
MQQLVSFRSIGEAAARHADCPTTQPQRKIEKNLIPHGKPFLSRMGTGLRL